MAQFYGGKSDVMIKIPKKVKEEAAEGLKLKKLNYKGGLETGIKRAHQLVNNESIPIEDLVYMYNWYRRHVYTSYPGYKKWIDSGKDLSKFNKNELRGAVSFYIWGGYSAIPWINKNINLISKFKGKNVEKIDLP